MTIIVCLNPPQLATVSACFGAVRALNSFVEQQHSYQSKQQWHIHLDFPDFPDFFFFFSFAARTKQRPNDVPLGRMCWTTTFSDRSSFFPTGGSKEEHCGQISCERPFLYVSHTMVCLSIEGRPSGHCGWQGKSVCTCSATQRKATGEYRK